jgi:hypothetical protein
MHIVALEFTADGPEVDHAEIDRMIAEVALQLDGQADVTPVVFYSAN